MLYLYIQALLKLFSVLFSNNIQKIMISDDLNVKKLLLLPRIDYLCKPPRRKR